MEKPTQAFNEDIFLCQKFIDIKNKYKLSTVIETGTYHGVTTKWFSQNFNNVYTVECNQEYYKIANENFNGINNIKSHFGDSPVKLAEFLNEVKEEETIVFLDAHWYTNPVLNELDSIKKSGKKPILAIHDFMVPDRPEFGYDIYPDQNIVYNWEWIKDRIEEIYTEGYIKEYNNEATGAMRGCIFIYPNKK